jgi:non-heme chloroperoxidase
VLKNMGADHPKTYLTSGAEMSTLEFVTECKKVTLPNSQRVNFVQFGTDLIGTVIFLHGYADSWRSFERIFPAFSDHYRCIALDLRGHGDSSKPEDGYGLKDFVEDVRLLLESLGIGKATLIGHSMGSFIAQKFAASYPDRVEKLVLISSSGKTKGNQVLDEVRAEIMKLEDPVEESFVVEFQTPGLPVPYEFMQAIVAESKKLPARIWKTVFNELITIDNCDILGRIQAKKLVLWGTRDGIFKKDDQELLTGEMNDVTFVAFDAGHALHWELPGRVAEVIVGFLEEK